MQMRSGIQQLGAGAQTEFTSWNWVCHSNGLVQARCGSIFHGREARPASRYDGHVGICEVGITLWLCLDDTASP